MEVVAIVAFEPFKAVLILKIGVAVVEVPIVHA